MRIECPLIVIISITRGHFGDGSNVRREQEDISRSKPAGLTHDRASFVFLPDRAEIERKIFELDTGEMGVRDRELSR